MSNIKEKNDIIESFLNKFRNETIRDSIFKSFSIINDPIYERIMCSVSGGSDSDIVMDIVNKLDIDKKVSYVWFDTGLEYKATKDHLEYLENRYDVEIKRVSPSKNIIMSCREYGQPFCSKLVSEMIQSLQRHDFTWEDRPMEELLEEYPNISGRIKWWCNGYEMKIPDMPKMFNIEYNRFLKEFMIENPPWFKVSNKCCDFAKKDIAHKYMKDNHIDLSITGVRKN